MMIETKRLILRDYNMADEDAYWKLKSDSETMYYLQGLRLFDREEAKKDFQRILRDSEDCEKRKYYFFHMELKLTHEQVGSIGYTVLSDTPNGKIVGAGYFIYPEFWNEGYTTEAFKKVLEFAFVQNNVYRVNAGCLEENIGSERVMQKCGLIKETQLVDCEWHDGNWKTRCEYRLLKHEWEDIIKNEVDMFE